MEINTNPCRNYQEALKNSTSLTPDELQFIQKMADICKALHQNVEKGRKLIKAREEEADRFEARLDKMFPPKRK